MDVSQFVFLGQALGFSDNLLIKHYNEDKYGGLIVHMYFNHALGESTVGYLPFNL